MKFSNIHGQWTGALNLPLGSFKMVYESTNRYTLTREGKWRFMRMRENPATAKFEGYEILDYLYDNGAGTIEEIENHTGISREKVIERLWAFINQRYVEKLSAP